MHGLSSAFRYLTVLALGVTAACRAGDYAELRPALRDLAALTGARTARTSSWDRTGGNRDCTPVEAGRVKVLGEIRGPGSIQHLYVGTTTPAGAFLRGLALRMYWDGAPEPSADVPLRAFFLTPPEASARA